MLKLGNSLTDRKDYDAATIAYHQVLRGRGVPDNDLKTALLGLARTHRRQGALTKAAALYEKFLKEYPEDPRTPDALLDLGRTLRGLGTYNLAITRFYSVINSTLKLSGGGFDHYQLLAKTAQFEIAETHFQSGNFPEAVKFFTRLRLLDLAPADQARAHFKSAYAQHLQGLNEPAVTNLNTFLEQWPNDENAPEARYLLAISLRELGRSQESFTVTLDLLRTTQSTMADDPKRWAYWQRRTGNQLANDFFATGNILNAHAIYSGLAELSADPAWRLPILYQVSLCLERLGLSDRAAETYRSIVEAGKSATNTELNELARMATWRLEHIDWNIQTNREVAGLFDTATGRTSLQSSPTPTKTADISPPTSSSTP
jgi:TolA-binding protein